MAAIRVKSGPPRGKTLNRFGLMSSRSAGLIKINVAPRCFKDLTLAWRQRCDVRANDVLRLPQVEQLSVTRKGSCVVRDRSGDGREARCTEPDWNPRKFRACHGRFAPSLPRCMAQEN